MRPNGRIQVNGAKVQGDDELSPSLHQLGGLLSILWHEANDLPSFFSTFTIHLLQENCKQREDHSYQLSPIRDCCMWQTAFAPVCFRFPERPPPRLQINTPNSPSTCFTTQHSIQIPTQCYEFSAKILHLSN
jgi:hypothetical protein